MTKKRNRRKKKDKIVFSLFEFYEVTPKGILVVADAIKGTCAIAAGYSLIYNSHVLSIITFIIVILCELVQRLFGIKKSGYHRKIQKIFNKK